MIVVDVMARGIHPVVVVQVVPGTIDTMIVIGVVTGTVVGAAATPAASTAAAASTATSAAAAAAILGERSDRQRSRRYTGNNRQRMAAMEGLAGDDTRMLEAIAQIVEGRAAA